MIFALITFFAAFLIEGIGTYTSIIGLSSLFSANPVIIALAISLDVGKLVVVSFLYNYWKKMGFVMRAYMLVASIILMVITSTGIAGYLTAEFQQAIVSTKESDIQVVALKEEKVKLEARKKEIDSQIANLPPNMVRGRTRLINEFKEELSVLNKRTQEIDKELPTLQVSKAHADAHAGPIVYVAQAFNVTVEEAVKYVILMIIFVFDPLAVVLIIAGNFLIAQYKSEKESEKIQRKKEEDEERARQHAIELDEIHHAHKIEEEKVEIERLHVVTPAVPVTASVVAHTEEVTPSVIHGEEIQTEEEYHEGNVLATVEEPIDEPEPSIVSEEQLDQILEVASAEEPVIEEVPEVPEVPEVQPDAEVPEVIEEIVPEAVLEVVVPEELPEVTAFADINSSRADVKLDGWQPSEVTAAMKMYRNDVVH